LQTTTRLTVVARFARRLELAGTHRSEILLASFDRTAEFHDVRCPLGGLKTPQSQSRLQSFSPDDEQAMHGAVEESFRNFLFAAFHRFRNVTQQEVETPTTLRCLNDSASVFTVIVGHAILFPGFHTKGSRAVDR